MYNLRKKVRDFNMQSAVYKSHMFSTIELVHTDMSEPPLVIFGALGKIMYWHPKIPHPKQQKQKSYSDFNMLCIEHY